LITNNLNVNTGVNKFFQMVMVHWVVDFALAVFRAMVQVLVAR
jgi:hypothetical protein